MKLQLTGSAAGPKRPAHACVSLVALVSMSVAACAPGVISSSQLADVSVSIAPTTATVAAGATQQFTATVTGTADTVVVWSIDEGSVAGSISSDGVFEASMTGGVYHVRATSRADSARSASATVTVQPVPGAPTIDSFAASPPAIDVGQTTTLSWSVTGATILAIDNGIGDVTGVTSFQVAPTATTTYVLRATNAAGSVSATARVTVTRVPAIASFTATPPTINPGQTSTLAWTVTDATSLTIDNGVGPVTGRTSIVVSPTTTTTYTLTATSSAGTATATAVVTVTDRPIIASFRATPPTIGTGQSSTLSWSVTGATSVSIDNGVGDVTGVSSRQVMPSATTTYTLTATNAAGSSTATAVVTVTNLPIIASFTATPSTIVGGQSSTLSWSVTGATSLSIDNGVGDVTGVSSRQVMPNATTTYTLTATNVAGTTTATAVVTVTNRPTIASFTATPSSILAGQSSTLSWSVTGATSLSIDHGVGSVTGLTSTQVMPSATTTYTLTATNAAGSSTATTTVTVGTVVGDFPLVISPNRRYLQDPSGVPFPILGRAAWAVTSLSVADYTAFLDDSAAKGFNAIEIRGLTHLAEENNAPFAGNGALPFTNRLDGATWTGSLSYGGQSDNLSPNFTTPNEAYWAFMDALFAACEQRGQVVLFFPAYVGYHNLLDEGWMLEMVKNGTTRMQAYGVFLATRYRNQKNLVWMLGGDAGTGNNTFTPEETAVEQALITGLKSVSGQQSTQFAAEWSSPSTGRDQVDFGDEVTLAGVYNGVTNGGQASTGRSAYSASSPIMPAFLLEEPYDEEGPDGNNRNPVATQPVRRFQWWGWLSTIGGYVAGNGYVWRYRSGWQSHLGTQGAQDMARLNAFIKSIAWSQLVPSGLAGMKTLVTSGGGSPGGTDYVAAAANPAGTLLVAYVPPDHGGSITIDMTAMSAPARARWFNPTTAAYTLIGNFPNTGTHVFTPPGNNGSPFNDWVLVIDPQ